MSNKIFFPVIAFVLIAILGITLVVNPSYERSLEAKYYYEMGEYEDAYELATEAFELDRYNRMASTIMAQSKTSLKYVKYINEAKGYMKQINDMAQNETITMAQRAKIKLMSEIMVKSYVKLAPSVITDSALVQEAKKYYDDFENLLEKVNR